MKYKTKGIVFNHIKFRESSIIARIYTDQFGLKNYIFNSVRTSKPRIPISYFQPLTMLDMIVYNKNHADINRVAEIKCRYSYLSVHYDVLKSTVALFITELLYKTLREEEANPELFRFLEESFMYYDMAEEGFVNFHLQFLFKYARYHGIEPIQIADMVHEIESNNFLVSIPRKDFEKIDQLIESPYTSGINLSNDLRRKLLSMIILFYQIHFDHLKDLKSFKVLMEVFDS
jgi:DNA repair protein RecO (recombination protein O)